MITKPKWLPVRLIGSTVLAGVFWLVWYDRHYRWTDCFNELGRCYDPVEQVVHLEQGGLLWGGLAIFFTAWALVRLLRLIHGLIRH